jgi:PPM family protein phosphatase
MKFPSFGFGKEKGPSALSKEEIDTLKKHGRIDDGDEAMVQAHPDYYRTLIADIEKSLKETVPVVVPETSIPEEVVADKKEDQKEAELEVFSGSLKAEKVGATENQDSVLALEDLKLFGVFDGMGGHAGGDVASGIVRNYLAEVFQSLPDGLTLEQIQEELKKALHDVNEVVLKKGDEDFKLHGMGTTASVAKLWESPEGEKKLIIANVGDSRVYVLRSGGEIEQVTLDDGLIRKEVEDEEKAKELQKKLNNTISADTLDDDEKYLFNKRNILTQSIGMSGMEPRMCVVDIKEGDRWVITSDGIHDNLTDIEIEEILRDSKSSKEATDALLKAALERSRLGREVHSRSKKDDMSVVVGDLSSGESQKTAEPAPLKEVPSTPETAPAKSEPVLKRRRFGWLFGKKEPAVEPQQPQEEVASPVVEQAEVPKETNQEEVESVIQEESVAQPEQSQEEVSSPIVSAAEVPEQIEQAESEPLPRDDEIVPDPEAEKEKYGKSFELREKIQESRKARANLILIEEELNKKRKWKFGISTKGVKEMEAKYKSAKENYEEKRAEYIGAKTWRLLKEKQKVAEEAARKYEESHKGEKYFLEKWRKLGEKNLLTLFGKEEWNPTTKRGKAAKFLARGLSARSAISFSLLGVGVLSGAGSAVGIGALIGRKAFSGVSSTIGTYDLLNLLNEKRNPDKTSELISKLKESPDKVTNEDIEKQMAELEVRAKFRGERIVKSDEYQTLQKEYLKRIDSTTDRENVIKKVLLQVRLDKQVEEQKTKVEKIDTRNKLIAGTVGTIISTGALSEMWKYIRSIPGGEDATLEEIRKIMEQNPALDEEAARALAENQHALPDSVLNAADRVRVPQESFEGLPGGDIAGSLPHEQIQDVSILGGGHIEVPVEHIGTVKAGGSAWQAAREMVRSGAISQEEFSRAWSSAASTVEMPSGQTIHISDLALVHEGNQVVFIPEANGVPAHFQVLDYAGKTLKVGSNEDLARAFDTAGRPRPEWLNRALGSVADSSTDTVATPSVTPPTELPDIQPDLTPAGLDNTVDLMGLDPSVEGVHVDTADTGSIPLEGHTGDQVINNAAENGYAPKEILRFSWGGRMNLVYNADGQIDGYIIETDGVTSGAKARVVERAVRTSFNRNYEEVLNSSVRDSLHNTLGEGPAFEHGVAEILPDVNAQAKELAFQFDVLRRAFDRAEPNSPEWVFLRNELRRMAQPDPNYPSSIILGGMRVSAGIFKPNIIP